MADELIHGATCGETWWSNRCTSRNMFGSSSLYSSSTIGDFGGAFGWSNISLFDDMKSPTTMTSLTDDKSLLHQDVHNVKESTDSTNTSEWNETLLETNESSHQGSYPIMLQEDFNLDVNNFHQQQNLMEFCPKTYVSDQESSTSTTFKPSALNPNNGLEQQQMSSDFTSTCEVLPTYYTLNPPSSCDHSSTILQHMFSDNTSTMQKPLYENYQPTNFASSSTASIDNIFRTNNINDDFSLKQHPLALSNNTSSLINEGVLPSPQLQVPSSSVGDKYNNRPKTTVDDKVNIGAEANKKCNVEPAFKRPRLETPSHLPTFKVRKEKLGDRITALQQLVSPFGKTDTASVLHEAIEYIKFLHDKVNVLSTPYMENGPPGQLQQGPDEQYLQSRGLCIVPLSSTFSLAAEPPTDFWTPTFGGAFRNDEFETRNGVSHIALACML
ncbi:basic helix-loop-helix transcription factor [Lithospermum erythrorhizon]|uniref:Basic helix-loop-helix transcription factor n=1 Tax=Lithospermum erythrorhizon TaxID=34254 RepID=A0AAV3NV87_LITER